jgi:hypothetical protein
VGATHTHRQAGRQHAGPGGLLTPSNVSASFQGTRQETFSADRHSHHTHPSKATAQPGNSANPSLNKSSFTVGTQGTLRPRPSPGCQSGVRRQSSGVMRHLLEHVSYLAKPLDLACIFCHRGREAIMSCAFEKVGGHVRGMRAAKSTLPVSH